jgi:hypothetical protein
MSSISVAGDVSGAISIAAPSAAGSGVLTLPTGTDTLVGKATTDTLTNKSIAATQLTGTIAAAALPAGSVLQVKQTVLSTAFTSATKGTYVAVTGLSVDITPISTSSKICIFANVISGSQNNLAMCFHIYRNASQVTPNGVATGFTPTSFFGGGTGGVAVNTGVSFGSPMNFLDSPASTSLLTYQVYAAVNSGASATLNVNPTAAAGGGQAGGSSTITVMEIAG